MLTEATSLVTHDHTLLLWEGSDLAGLSDVVVITVNLNLIVACDHVRLVDVDVGPLLISGQDDLVVDAQSPGVFKDHSQVLGTLHVVFASVVVVANV